MDRWATRAGRVEVLSDGHGVLEQAVANGPHGVADHGVEQSVMIAATTRRAAHSTSSRATERREDGRARRGARLRAVSRSRSVTG